MAECMRRETSKKATSELPASMVLTTRWRRKGASKTKARGRKKYLINGRDWSLEKNKDRGCIRLKLQLQCGDTQTFILRSKTKVCLYHVPNNDKLFGKYMFKIRWRMGILCFSLLVNTLQLISDFIRCNDTLQVQMIMIHDSKDDSTTATDKKYKNRHKS